MRRNETPEPIWVKFCVVIDISNIITCTIFGDHWLRGFRWWGSNFPLSHRLFIVALTTLSHYRASMITSIRREKSLTNFLKKSLVRPDDACTPSLRISDHADCAQNEVLLCSTVVYESKNKTLNFRP